MSDVWIETQYLLNVMMSVYIEYQCVYMSVITQDGFSALMVAVREGKTEVFAELVKAGANVDMQNKVYTYMYMYLVLSI